MIQVNRTLVIQVNVGASKRRYQEVEETRMGGFRV